MTDESPQARADTDAPLDPETINNLEKTVEYADSEQTESPFTVEVHGSEREKAEELHEERSRRSRRWDERYNAPTTTDFEKWASDMDHYDYPGVDTIPESRLRERGERVADKAEEKGVVDRVEFKGNAKRLQGKFSPAGNSTYGRGEDVVRVQNTAENPEFTLAHELGHAIDFDAGEDRRYGITDRLFEDRDAERREEAKPLSKQMRGGWSEYTPKHQRYRQKREELTADFLASAVLQPRATRRESPELFNRLQAIKEEDEELSELFSDL